MRFLPRDERFFDLFASVAERSVEAATLLGEIFKAPSDRRTYLVESIKRVEHECDQLTHEVITRLDRSFITPLDREDIHGLASALDDVVDYIDSLARRIQIYQIGESPEGAVLLSDVIRRACAQIVVAVKALGKSGNADVLPACIAIKRLEEEGDSLYQEWLGQMFRSRPDAVQLIAWKEVYDNLEKTLDHCEDVANILESISIKHG